MCPWQESSSLLIKISINLPQATHNKSPQSTQYKQKECVYSANAVSSKS